jgi:kumamolisin
MFANHIRYPRTSAPVSMTPRQVATAYHFPMDKSSGKGYTGGIIELGGGYSLKQVDAYFTSQGLRVPVFVSVNVDGGSNTSDGPDGADGEVQLDMIVAGAIAPGATYRVYFAANTDAAFLAALKQACSECDGVSISWGAAESDWTPSVMDQFETVIKAARSKGVPVFVAAGDNGSKDSTGTNQTDFPSSSPSAIGCGGTRLTLAGTQRSSETVWNDNPTQSATGGGISKHFPGRDVPDIAGNADPDSGYEVMVDGQSMVVGGTSAVAPLMLGLHALLFELVGATFDFGNLITTNPQACYDVTVGSNGGFRAGPGRDETTGFGVPDGGLLLAALTSGIPAPVPPSPAPAPVPTPVPTPSTDFPVAAVDAWFQHKHNYSQVELAAAHAIAAWAPAHGITLAPAVVPAGVTFDSEGFGD